MQSCESHIEYVCCGSDETLNFKSLIVLAFGMLLVGWFLGDPNNRRGMG